MTRGGEGSPDSSEKAAPPLHRNVWATSATSFLTDVSSEMILNVLPLFLANVLGVRVWAVGVVEGLADATAAIAKLYSGWLSDRLRARKWLAVGGYAVSTAVKPLYLLVGSWGGVAAIRWGDRMGKGIRTAPRDALLADSSISTRRGLVFGVHRAADTAGAVVGLALTLWIVGRLQGGDLLLADSTFRGLVLWSLLPAVLAVIVLAVGASDVPIAGRNGPSETSTTSSRGSVSTADASGASPDLSAGHPEASEPRTRRPRPPCLRLRGLGRGFGWFVASSVLFELGNSADAFLVLRAQERGLTVTAILGVLLAFNVVYAVVAVPAGSLADRLGRKRMLLAAWIVYAVAYCGFALAGNETHVAGLFLLYGAYHGMAAGAAKALVADLVPDELRGLAYGGYSAAVGIVSLPASILGGVLWEGIAGWTGFGPAAPFWFGSGAAMAAALLLAANVPDGEAPTG